MKRNIWYLLPVALVTLGIWNSLKNPMLVDSPVNGDITAPESESENQASDEGLFFTSKEADLGVVKEPTTYHFPFENRATVKAEILELNPSCNCTVPKLEKTSFQPGEKGKISIETDLRGRKIGPQLFVINVKYRTILIRETRLALHAVYRPDLVVPTDLKVRLVRGGKPQRIPFAVIDYRDSPFVIQQISTTSPSLKVEIKETPSSYLPGWKHELELVAAQTDQPVGNNLESITLLTNDPEHKGISIPVLVERVGRIRVSPAKLSLRPTDKVGVQMGKVFVDDREGGEIEIDSVELPSPALEWNGNPNFPGSKVFQVTLDENKLSSTPTGALRIKLRFKKPIQEETWIDVIRKP